MKRKLVVCCSEEEQSTKSVIRPTENGRINFPQIKKRVKPPPNCTVASKDTGRFQDSQVGSSASKPLKKSAPQELTLLPHEEGDEILLPPWQPLVVDLKADDYSKMMRDPAKYKLYQKAIELALVDLKAKYLNREECKDIDVSGPAIPHRGVSIMVVGAGFGGLVSRCIAASKATGVKISRLVAVEKNSLAVKELRLLQKQPGWECLQVVEGDVRLALSTEPATSGSAATPATAPAPLASSSDTTVPTPVPTPAPEAPDMRVELMVSELLGGLGDNELSPECLYAAQHALLPGGVCIPSRYTSYLAPYHAPVLSFLLNNTNLGSTVPPTAAPGSASVKTEPATSAPAAAAGAGAGASAPRPRPRARVKDEELGPGGQAQKDRSHQSWWVLRTDSPVLRRSAPMLLAPPRPALTFSHPCVKVSAAVEKAKAKVKAAEEKARAKAQAQAQAQGGGGGLGGGQGQKLQQEPQGKQPPSMGSGAGGVGVDKATVMAAGTKSCKLTFKVPTKKMRSEWQKSLAQGVGAEGAAKGLRGGACGCGYCTEFARMPSGVRTPVASPPPPSPLSPVFLHVYRCCLHLRYHRLLHLS